MSLCGTNIGYSVASLEEPFETPSILSVETAHRVKDSVYVFILNFNL